MNLTSSQTIPLTKPGYFYNITMFDGEDYRGRCEKCPDTGCGGKKDDVMGVLCNNLSFVPYSNGD